MHDLSLSLTPLPTLAPRFLRARSLGICCIMGVATTMEGVLHPYMPTSLQLPGFHPALMSYEFILGCYGGASTLVILLVWLASGLFLLRFTAMPVHRSDIAVRTVKVVVM